MNYAILRVQKLKTNNAVRGSLRHAFREQNTPNADPARLDDNSHIGAKDVASAMAAYKERLPDKVRKNGVRCIEYLMTASNEKMADMNRGEQDAYFKDALGWLREKHGAENVVYAGIHRDETTPHMYAYVVPHSQERDKEGNLKKPGKLNCREFLGGSKHVLSELQDEFAERVGKVHGMDRGVKGSKARHQTIKQYYTNLNAQQQNRYDRAKPRLLKKGRFINTIESKDQIIERLADYSVSVEDRRDYLEREKQKDLKTMHSLQSQLEELQPARDLYGADREKLLTLARVMKAEKDAKDKREMEARRAQRRKVREENEQ